jgi:hypothetical protein
LSDKTGIIKYLFINWTAFKLRSALVAIMYIIRLNIWIIQYS